MRRCDDLIYLFTMGVTQTAFKSWKDKKRERNPTFLMALLPHSKYPSQAACDERKWDRDRTALSMRRQTVFQ